MSAKEKCLQYAKSKKNRKSINLQQLALEYQKLLNKKFFYCFQGGLKIEFQFKTENFYHLLGFHKLTDVSFVEMVENKKMKKEDFYKYVLTDKISLAQTDRQLLTGKVSQVVNICDTKKKSDFGEIKAHRFEYFTAERVLDLLMSDPVIDFDGNESETEINADKIFFKMHRDKMKNLNLFIGYNEDNKNHFVSTFFLEMQQDRYRLKKTREPQSVLYILSRCIINTENNKIEDFKIKWKNIRKELNGNSYYRAQNRLKVWINSNHIESHVVEEEIEIQKKMLIVYQEQLEQLEIDYQILSLLERMEKSDAEREHIILALMDYNLDAENSEELVPYLEMDICQIRITLNKLGNKRLALENKLKKHQQLLPELRMLEKEELILAYSTYFPETQWEDDILFLLLEEKGFFSNSVPPDRFMELYLERKDSIHKK